MIFHSKIDKFFLFIIFFAIFTIGASTLLPLLFDNEATTTDVYILLSIFFVSSGFLLWSSFSITYTFYEDHLFVKGGPFRSKIPYGHITKISKTDNILVGYRILSSKDCYEIFYTSGALGSVKISPKDPERFVSELKKRCSFGSNNDDE
ncbi:PH (Pleckstrin Homology) domain-containing protein [Bacillus thuringiensis]|uniref:PH (Pleckstrin Homology) domain-containing protein n=1 Tax=Bacillus thuringiensis TaxID=1428 RepID=A0A4R4BED4_BACTU|nr:PH domain-containing protein [Bacillus thuringiensis]TCW53294.1 PH (Pleckstrin Homology) domain-containing protein [Bacillus thuringiensis]TCW53475.1 PH (Pleckstrin Homology) domain-containing protein [Bacillus thuringiensis]